MPFYYVYMFMCAIKLKQTELDLHINCNQIQRMGNINKVPNNGYKVLKTLD